ncbi:MAG: hypothetical protein IJD83_08940, partial [Clostridia bacterium]|nr:hypothetical protein [Clostridia bacterium]
MRNIKKAVCLLLAVAVLLPTIATAGIAADAENVLFSYDFSEFSAGQQIPTSTKDATMFSGVHGNTSTSPAVIKAHDESGNMCAEYSNIGDSNSGPKLIRRTNFSRLTNLTVQCRAKGDKQLQLALYSEQANHAIYNILLDAKVWKAFEYRFDIKNGTYDVYMEGKAVAEKQKLPDLGNPGAVEVRFGTGIAPGETMYLDDVVFSTTDDVKPEDIFLNTTNMAAGEAAKPAEVTDIKTAPPAISVPKDMNVLLLDTMDAHPGKLVLEQWSTVMGNGTYVNAVTAADNKLLAFTNTDTVTHGPRLEKILGANGITKVFAEMDYYRGSNVLNVEMLDANGKSARVFMIKNAAEAEKDGWNRLKVAFDIAGSRAISYVNGTQVAEASLDTLSGDTEGWVVRINCGLAQNEATYLDNCVIYTPDDLGDQMFSYDGSVNFEKVFPAAPTGMIDVLRPHPRLLVTDWDAIREKIATDYRCARWYADILSQANGILNAEPIEHKTNVRGNANDSLLALERRIIILAFATAVEESDTYKNRLMQEIRYVRDSWPNWGEDIFLVCAHAIRVHAFAYDWCYNLFTDAERKEVLDILVNDAISLSVRAFEGRLSSGYVFTKEHNQNMASTASVLQAAIAVADEYPDAAEYLFEKCRGSIEYTLVEIGEDGSFSETMEYFTGGVGELYHYCAALDSAVKDGASVPSALDISGTPGLDKAVDFPIYYQGPVAAFNYGDSVSNRISTPMMFYAANKYGKPQYAWYLLKLDEEDASLRLRGREAAYALALFDPNNVDAGDFALDKAYIHKEPLGVNGFSLRSSWT